MIYLIHSCCGDGMKMAKDYVIAHPNTKLKLISYFQAHELKFPQKYGFNLEDLKTYSFLADEEKILDKQPNKNNKPQLPELKELPLPQPPLKHIQF